MSEQDKDQAASDLEVLNPDRSLVIGKPPREITVREFRFLEGLKVHVLAKPIVDDMLKLFGTTDIEQIDLDRLGEVFANHDDELVSMMCIAADVDAEFIASLSDADGQQLFLTFWQVNMLFFVRRLLAKRNEQRRASGPSRTPKANAGAASTPA